MSYNANDIETLHFKDAIRTRIAMYMGSADNSGILQCIREVITNSIDEFTMGYGNQIKVELFKGNKIKITDNARGTPFGERADGTEALIATCMIPHSGGKFNQKTYQNAAGQNGIGIKGVALSAKDFMIESYRDHKKATLKIHEGLETSFIIEEESSNQTGTVVTFTPDETVYHLEPINISFDEIKKMCKDWSYLTKGLEFVIINHVTKETIKYVTKNGIIDLVKDKVKKGINSSPIYYTITEDNITVEVALQWARGKEDFYVFTNGLYNAIGGTSLTGAKTAVTRTINNIIGKKLSGDTARTGLIYVINAKIPNPSFSDQTKTRVNNPELRKMADKAVSEALKMYSQQHPTEFEKIADFLLKEEKAEIAAEKARQAVLNHQKEFNAVKKQKMVMVDKLKDAERLGEDSILLVVEGDSAASSMAVGRDTSKYGILALRGKVINCLSNPIEDILENEEVKSFLKAIGCSYNNYNSKKLRYGKIAIAVDADSDGSHIACLIMALVHKLAPQLLEENRLYWLKAPLYRVKKGKETAYYYSDEEMKNGIKGTTIRFKGLGQMSADDTEISMFDSKWQRMEQLNFSKEGVSLLENLMGEAVQPRKDFVFSEIDFSEYGEV